MLSVFPLGRVGSRADSLCTGMLGGGLGVKVSMMIPLYFSMASRPLWAAPNVSRAIARQ